MRMTSLLAVIVAIALIPGAYAHGGHSGFSDVQGLLEKTVPCEQLSEEQLERLGEYFMELRHPGEEHEFMDKIMGGESETLKGMHVQMGRAFYCDSAGMGSSGMMMDSGMMGFAAGQGMMNGYSGMMYGYGWIYLLAGTIIVLLVIIALLLRRK